MKPANWNSTPSFIKNYMPINMAALLFIGIIFLIGALYSLASTAYFLYDATALDAPITDVRQEYVPKGRGSVLAYVPIVASPTGTERMRVDTYSEENIYPIGTRMRVLCHLSASRCIRNTILDLWGGGLLTLTLAALCLGPSLIYFTRRMKNAKDLGEVESPIGLDSHT